MKVKAIVTVFVAAALVGCGGQPYKNESPPPVAMAESLRPEAKSPMQAARETMEQRFLAQAEDAFRKGRLTTPALNNAYDSFHSVLLINPDNQHARSGLQAILIRYADMIREAMAASRYTQSQALIRQAQIYYPDNQLLLDLQQEIRKLQYNYQQTVLAKPTNDLTLQEFQLPRQMLSDNRDALLPFISSIAQRLEDTDESVMIYARTDAEGRWIYQQMKNAVPGYRVRGDIRLSKSPKIAILPPL